jgi:hypothetical protein
MDAERPAQVVLLRGDDDPVILGELPMWKRCAARALMTKALRVQT